jgi:phenylacetate-CoA ligase
LERESWSVDQWDQWREERLAFILERARKTVPYYKEYWDAHSDSYDWKDLSNWPVLEKSALKKEGIRILSSDFASWRMFEDNTSGTTGTPLTIWSSRKTLQSEYALFEARVRRWNGVTRNDRWAIIGGQMVVPVSRRTPPFWVWNSPMNQLYMSAYHISEETANAYLDAINDYGIKYIVAYPSALYSLARWANRKKRKDVRLQFAVANAEPLYSHQRDEIAEAFGCPVRETYGMAEWVAFASECRQGRLHVSPEVGVLETDDSGDLIATGLINEDMPLIRYRIGDRVILSDDSCECGRKLPLIQSVEGRSDDVLVTKDGREVGRLDPVFKGFEGIVEAQIIQRSVDELSVRYVPDESFDRKLLAALRESLCERLGDIEIEFEQVDAIPRTSNGKFRAVISEISGAVGQWGSRAVGQ